jgi:hypothetical protein
MAESAPTLTRIADHAVVPLRTDGGSEAAHPDSAADDRARTLIGNLHATTTDASAAAPETTDAGAEAALHANGGVTGRPALTLGAHRAAIQPADLIALQRLVGNRAVANMVDPGERHGDGATPITVLRSQMAVQAESAEPEPSIGSDTEIGSAAGGGLAAAGGSPPPSAPPPAAAPNDGSTAPGGRPVVATQRDGRAIARPTSPAVVQREDPKKPVPSDPDPATPAGPPVAVQIEATGLDEAASFLADTTQALPWDVVIYGLHATFLIVYDKYGQRMSGKIPLELQKGMHFSQGVFAVPRSGGPTRRLYEDRVTHEWTGGEIGGLMKEAEKKPAGAPSKPTQDAAPASGDKGAAKPAGDGAAKLEVPLFDLKSMVKDFPAIQAALAGHNGAQEFFLIPTYTGGASTKKAGGTQTTGFASELAEGGTGPTPNAPPWPVTMDGPKMQPLDADGTFGAKINWAANGRDSLSSQVITQVGTSIHYRWEVFDVTKYAKENEAKTVARALATKAMIAKVAGTGAVPVDDPKATVGSAKTAPGPSNTPAPVAPAAPAAAPAGAPAAPAGTPAAPGATPAAPGATPAEPSYEDILDQKTHSGSGSGTDVTGMGGANREFRREFENVWRDSERAASDLKSGKGDTWAEQQSNMEANLTALQLMPVSLLVTALGASLRWVAELFAGERQQQEIPWKSEGVFLVRVITTPIVSTDKDGKEVVRPSSVASQVVEVVPMERMVRESLDDPGAILAGLDSELKLAKGAKTPDQAHIDDLQKALEVKRLELTGDPMALLQLKIELKAKELEAVKARYEGKLKGPIIDAENELEALQDRLAVYEHQEAERTAGNEILPAAQRINATLISEVTGGSYPLVLTVGPTSKVNGRHTWQVLDATSKSAESFTGSGDTPSAALKKALIRFGEKAAYGNGMIGVRIPDTVVLEKEAKPTDRDFRVVSAPTGWNIARARIDDLVMVLAAIGLFVASAGTASAIIGAAVAAARLIERMRNGTLLHLDAAAVSDALAILGAAGIASQAAAGMRFERLGEEFVMLQEGAATSTQLETAGAALAKAGNLAKGVEMANEILNYAGVIWGNVTFLDSMMSINEQENDPDPAKRITHADARRQRANAIGGAVNNNGMFLAGNIKGAHDAHKAATADHAGAPGHEVIPHEGGQPGEKPATTEGKPGTTEGPVHEGPAPEGPVHEGPAPEGPVHDGPATGKEPTSPSAGGTPTGPSATAKGGIGTEPGATTHGGGGATTGGHPEPTAAQQQVAAHDALRQAAGGNGDLAAAAKNVIGKGSWKGDLKATVGKLPETAKAAAEKALVEARDNIVKEAWKPIAEKYPGLVLDNPGTKSFGSDIDATVRPEHEANTPGTEMSEQIKAAAEAGHKLSEALRDKLGGEMDIAIDTNIYSFVGEGKVTPTDAAGKGARQHVDMMVGLAEQMRGQSEQQFQAFEKRMIEGLGRDHPAVGAEAKQLLAEAREFHDARATEWKDARAKAKRENPKESSTVVDRMAREDLLGQKKAKLADQIAAPTPDHAAITRTQSEINWFAPDAYATPSAFQQAVAHGQRLRGTKQAASEMTGKDVAAKLREAAATLPPDNPRAQRLAREAALVESQQRLLDMTVKELATEQDRTPGDPGRIKELEQRSDGLRKEIEKAAEPVVVADILGSTMASDRSSGERLGEASSASAANLGMLEAHVASAHDVDGRVKAASKYAGRIAMAEFLSGLKPSSEPIATLLGEFVKSRMAPFEDASPMVMRDMFLRYAELTGRGKEVVHNDRGEPIGVSDAVKDAFVNDVRDWARGTNDEIQRAAIGAKAFENPSEPGSNAKTTSTPGPKPEGGSGSSSEPSSGSAPTKDVSPETVKPAHPEAITASGGITTPGETPLLNPPGQHQPFGFRFGSLTEGTNTLRRLANGDPTALTERGITLPTGYKTQGREFGLALLPDGTHALVQGDFGGVNWDNLPVGSVPLAHSHPLTEGKALSRPGTVGDIASRQGKSTSDGPSPETVDRVNVFPSAADLRFCAANRITNHDVHSPYVHTGDGVLKTPTGAPNEMPVSFNIFEATHIGNYGTRPVIEASIVAHDANGNVLFVGRMRAVDIAGESMISFEPMTGLDPPDPHSLDSARMHGGSATGGGATTPAGKTGSGPAPVEQGAAGQATIPGGITVTADGAAILAKSRRDPAAFVRIETDGDSVRVSDVYRRPLPDGSGAILMAEGLRGAKVAPGNEVTIHDIVDPETLKSYKNKGVAADSKLGKTIQRALESIGLTPATMDWQIIRGKLAIVVKVA